MKTVFVALFAMSLNAFGQVLPAPSNPDCFNSDVRSALTRIRSASAEVDQVLNDIEQLKYKGWVVMKTEGPSVTETENNHAIIEWPGAGGRYPNGSCITADANLVHEIWHCWVRARNNGEEDCKWDVETKLASDGTKAHMKRCEFLATVFENRYRKIVGLCERATYDNFVIPDAPQVSCADLSCPAPESSCVDACCWVYGGIKKETSPGVLAWFACVIPHSLEAACNDFNNRGGQFNAGWYPGANCAEGPDPICSGLK